MLERWWDALKKVIRLHSAESMQDQAIRMGMRTEDDKNEINHYYVFIK